MMERSQIDPVRIKQVRDMILRYLYENGAGNFSFGLDAHKVQQAIGATSVEFDAAVRLMISQSLFGDYGVTIGSIGINDRGQREAERLGPKVLLREQEPPSHVTINAKYSVVQVAGNNSTQTAHLSIDQSRIETVLNEIERAIPTLEISAAKRDEAKGLLASLRDGLGAKIGDAGLRAIGGALGSILVAAGSPLGQRLMEALNIAVG